MARKAKDVPVLNANGLNQHSIGFDENNNVKPTTGTDKGGNSSKYRIAKLKRDHPEIAERMIAGEFKTVSEAERADSHIEQSTSHSHL